MYDPNPYFPDEVKLEVSVRSLKIPAAVRPVISMLSASFPNTAYEEHPFDVPVVLPHKTFLEKAFLLHEEFSKPDKTKIRHERMSRHFSDLVAIMDSTAAQALADHDLYDQLIANREAYMRLPFMNYALLDHSTISFLPPQEVIQAYEQDYSIMQENMIYEDSPAFSEIMNRLKLLQGKFRLKYAPHSIELVVENAMTQIAETQDEIVTITLSVPIDQQQVENPENPATAYRVTFIRQNGGYQFEDITIL